MANDLSSDQLLRQENDKLRRAQQTLTTVNEGLLSEQHALRTETHALRVANEAQKTQIDALKKGRNALMVKIRSLEDRVLRSDSEGARVSPNASGEYHEVDPSIIRIREMLKRKFGYLENGDDTQVKEPDDQRSGTANNDGMATSDVESLHNISGAEVISLGESDVSVVEEAQQHNDDRTLSIRVLAFDEQGKTFILDEADEPAGLRALITTTEVLLKEEFDKHRSGAKQQLQLVGGLWETYCSGEGKNTELERVAGEIWLKRKKRDRKSRSKTLQSSAQIANNLTTEEQV
ncbi:hypothetical protein LTR17_000993 [Elasticomyces elasticus]|nr:hypothetical protein LTR17_000993 [Elasticomyces elasticus]